MNFEVEPFTLQSSNGSSVIKSFGQSFVTFDTSEGEENMKLIITPTPDKDGNKLSIEPLEKDL